MVPEVWSAMCKDYCVIFNTWWRGILWLHNEYFIILCHYSTVRNWIRLNHFSRISNSGSTKRHKHFFTETLYFHMEWTHLFRWNKQLYNRQNNAWGALHPCYMAFKSSFFPMIKICWQFYGKNFTRIDDNADLKNISDHIWFPQDFCRIWMIPWKEK